MASSGNSTFIFLVFLAIAAVLFVIGYSGGESWRSEREPSGGTLSRIKALYAARQRFVEEKLPTLQQSVDDKLLLLLLSRAYRCERHEWPRSIAGLEEFTAQTSEILVSLPRLGDEPLKFFPLEDDLTRDFWSRNRKVEFFANPSGTLTIQTEPLPDGIRMSLGSDFEVTPHDCSILFVHY